MFLMQNVGGELTRDECTYHVDSMYFTIKPCKPRSTCQRKINQRKDQRIIHHCEQLRMLCRVVWGDAAEAAESSHSELQGVEQLSECV